MIPEPNVPAYADENRCPFCRSVDSIDIIARGRDRWDQWTDDNLRLLQNDDELCHCNICGKSFIQHYERVFVGQTGSGDCKAQPMPPTREELLEKAALNLSQYVEQLLERIEECEDAWRGDTPDHDPPLQPSDVADSFKELIESHTCTQVKKHLANLDAVIATERKRVYEKGDNCP
jgi:hypothetical protein